MKRLISLLAVAACLLGASPAMADDAVADGAGLPDHIVNGDFEYPAVPKDEWRHLGGKNYITVNPDTGRYCADKFNNIAASPIQDWNDSLFAWRSTQTAGSTREAGSIELNYDTANDNQFVEVIADQQYTGIYQDVRVEPGTMLTWSLRHTSVDGKYDDRMQVLIGLAGKERVSEATRVASENGNPVGATMDTITTHTVSNDRGSKKWDTYTGTYLVPDDATTVRFTFKSLSQRTDLSGNDLDDVSFSKSHMLHYDANGGTGTIADQPVGDGVNAYTATEGYTLAGHRLTGWNTKPDGTGDAYKPGETIAIDKPTTLYAQWADVTQTTMPETGGTMTPRTPTTILGGGLPSGPHSNPAGKTAPAPVIPSGKAV